jgi:ribosomal protein L7/L12
MSKTNLNIINATRKIVKMHHDTLEDLILNILADHPTIVMRKMGMDIDIMTYKVVVDVFPCMRKIPLIKLFRGLNNASLAESKYWVEGTPYNDLPSGVFKSGLTLVEANKIAHTLNDAGRMADIRVKVVPDNEPYNLDAHTV